VLALALSVTVLAAPPVRGFHAVHTIELITQVESRLPKWLELGGDRTALLATAKELETSFFRQGVKKADLKSAVDVAVAQQAEAPALKTFIPTRALVESDAYTATVHFFDDAGRHCGASLLVVSTQFGAGAGARFLLMRGPFTDDRSLDAVADAGKSAEKMVVYAEKKADGWTTGSRPPRPPADCQSSMKAALEALYAAEKAWFAEHDAYSKAVTKLGVDLTKLGVTSAKISIGGYPPRQTFTIEVGLRGGVMQMNEKGEANLIGDCTR
jgi:hypothetical protein